MKEAERWKQVPSQHECVEEASIQPSRYHTNCTTRDLCFESGLPFYSSPFITLYLFLSRFSHGFSHTLMGVILFILLLSCAPCFLPPLSSLLLTLCFFILLPSLPHDRTIHPGSVLTSVYESAGCSSEARQHVAYVEHVVVRVTITHSRRGDLSITLTSPSGTVSQLLANR